MDTFNQLQLTLPAARGRDPRTSVMAGVNAQLRSGSQRMRLLQAFADHPEGLTDEGAAIVAGLFSGRAAYWRRCSDLRELGLICFTGAERVGSSGEKRKVSEITSAGWDALGVEQ